MSSPSESNQYIDDKGYLRILAWDHPNNNKGYMLAHRLLMEQKIGRLLRDEEVVHHIDEDKLHNELSNLFLCTPDEHTRIHNRDKRRSLQRRSNIRKGVIKRNQKNRKGGEGGS